MVEESPPATPAVRQVQKAAKTDSRTKKQDKGAILSIKVIEKTALEDRTKDFKAQREATKEKEHPVRLAATVLKYLQTLEGTLERASSKKTQNYDFPKLRSKLQEIDTVLNKCLNYLGVKGRRIIKKGK